MGSSHSILSDCTTDTGGVIVVNDELILTEACSVNIMEKVFALLRGPFVSNPKMTDSVLGTAKEVWTMIQNDDVIKYRTMLDAMPSEKTFSCTTWFVRKLYARMGELDPVAYDLYPESLAGQVALVTKMMSSIFSLIARTRSNTGGASWSCTPDAASQTTGPHNGDGVYPTAGPLPINRRRKGDPVPPLFSLARAHFLRGIETNQYVVMGLALLSAFKYCLGEQFTRERQRAWVVLYSTVLMSVVPYSMALERRYSIKSTSSKTASHAGSLPSWEGASVGNLYLAAEKLDNLRSLNENSVSASNHSHSHSQRSSRSNRTNYAAHGDAGNPAGLIMMAITSGGGGSSANSSRSVAGNVNSSSRTAATSIVDPLVPQSSTTSRRNPAVTPLASISSPAGNDPAEAEFASSDSSDTFGTAGNSIGSSSGNSFGMSGAAVTSQPNSMRMASVSEMQQNLLATVLANAASPADQAASEEEAANCAVTSYFMMLAPSDAAAATSGSVSPAVGGDSEAAALMVHEAADQLQLTLPTRKLEAEAIAEA